MLRRALPLALLALAACAPEREPTAPPVRPVSVPAEPLEATSVAVVELFTSEGCSSCPPADAVLAELSDDAGVIALAFHVDYWDRLGWRDPYASAAFTARQRAYARAMGTARVYTPQMIVGGTSAFVGSRRAEAGERIARVLGRPLPVVVTVEARAAGDSVEVAYAADGAPAGAVVHLALVQRQTRQLVARGENRGRLLEHAHVVRAFETVAAGSGRRTLVLPDGLTAYDVRAVAYAQQGEVGAVLGAAMAEVES